MIRQKLVIICVFTLNLATVSADEDIYQHFFSSLHKARSPVSRSENGQCSEQHSSLFSKQEININLSIGYVDHSEPGGLQMGEKDLGPNYVLDQFGHRALRQVLTLPCFNNLKACGFTYEKDESDSNTSFLTKFVIYRGKPKLLKIVLSSPSVSPSNRDNVEQFKDLQLRKSLRSEFLFFDAFRMSDINIYMGHARKGYGADFSPPLLFADGTPNYPQYEKERINYHKMLSTLDLDDNEPFAIGLLACFSKQLFMPGVSQRVDASLLLSSNGLIRFEHMLVGGLVYLDSILNQRCKSQTIKALSSAMPEFGHLFEF